MCFSRYVTFFVFFRLFALPLEEWLFFWGAILLLLRYHQQRRLCRCARVAIAATLAAPHYHHAGRSGHYDPSPFDKTRKLQDPEKTCTTLYSRFVTRTRVYLPL